jgi:hypothetical protein
LLPAGCCLLPHNHLHPLHSLPLLLLLPAAQQRSQELCHSVAPAAAAGAVGCQVSKRLRWPASCLVGGTLALLVTTDLEVLAALQQQE